MNRRVGKSFSKSLFRYLPFIDAACAGHIGDGFEVAPDHHEGILDTIRNRPVAYLPIKEARGARLGFDIARMDGYINDQLWVVLLRIEPHRKKARKTYRAGVVCDVKAGELFFPRANAFQNTRALANARSDDLLYKLVIKIIQRRLRHHASIGFTWQQGALHFVKLSWRQTYVLVIYTFVATVLNATRDDVARLAANIDLIDLHRQHRSAFDGATI